MWPIMFTLLNLPCHLRNKFEHILLVTIIPPTGYKEPADLNPYLEIVVDELLSLSNSVFYDVYRHAPFNVKTHILLNVLDYPGVAKVFKTMDSGAYQGCI